MLQNNPSMPDDPGSRLMRNKASLRKVNRFFNVASIIYAVTCLVYAGISVFMIILFVSGGFLDTFIMFIDGVVLKAAVLYFGYQSCYKHDNRFTFLPLIIQTVDFSIVTAAATVGICDFMGSFAVLYDLIFLALYAFLSILIVPYNKEYQYLESQEGFPYFNERAEEDKIKRRQFETANPFVMRKKELEKNSSEDMDLLDYSLRSGDNGSGDLKGKGSMDEI